MSTGENPDGEVEPGIIARYWEKLARLGGYALWTAAGAMLPLAIDRLVIHPALNQHLGKDLFGSLVWVLGIVNWIGSSPAEGFAVLLMRDSARQAPEAAGRMLRTSLSLTIVLSMIVVPLAFLASTFFADDLVRANSWSLYLPLGAFAVLRGGSVLLIYNLRFQRMFKTIFFLRVAEAAVLLVNLAVAPLGSVALIGLIYIASVILAVPIAVAKTGELRGRTGWLDPHWIRSLMGGWTAGATLHFLNSSQLYLSRSILGAMADVGEVAIFYAGTAMGNLFVVPVTVLAVLVLSLLGGRKDFVFKGNTRLLYLAATYGLALFISLASWIGGRWLVQNRYPDLASETLEFYHWIAVGNGCVTVIALMAPMVIKYARLSTPLLVAASTFAVQGIALVALVPGGQAAGAAQGLALAMAFGGLFWTVMALGLDPASGRGAE